MERKTMNSSIQIYIKNMLLEVYVDDNFSYPFKSYLGKDAAYNIINSMIKESKYRKTVLTVGFLIVFVLRFLSK